RDGERAPRRGQHPMEEERRQDDDRYLPEERLNVELPRSEAEQTMVETERDARQNAQERYLVARKRAQTPWAIAHGDVGVSRPSLVLEVARRAVPKMPRLG